MFPGLTELHLIGYSIELKSGPQNPNQIHRHQKTTRWHSNQREFHTWWTESFVVFVLTLVIPVTVCSEVMSKRTQKDSGEEWVTSKSKPMLVSRCSERTLDVLYSRKLVKIRHESRIPLSSWIEQQPRTGDLWWTRAHQTKQNGILTKSGLLKSGNLMNLVEARTERPVGGQPFTPSHTSLSSMTMIWTLTPPQKQPFF